MSDERVSSALVSILMPCCGQLEYTRLSVPRLMQYSRPRFDLLFVDAGSLDGTEDNLAGVVAAAPIRVEVLRRVNEEDFPLLVAQALSLARGAFVAWVNSDVLVPELWLQQLLALATANDLIGVVGPMAPVGPEQQRLTEITYRLGRPRAVSSIQDYKEAALETLAVDYFAKEFRAARHGQWSELELIGGFCWLSRREVIERVELLGQGSEEGLFDASLFSRRVRQAGYRLACCNDLYVHHHFGSNLLRG
jgi:GT2 family glycosyltransferase